MKMKKVKVGVLGGLRGIAMMDYCTSADNAELVAICDKNLAVLESRKEIFKDKNVAFYDDYDKFLEHDIDAVVLANYATEHAPFAIKALKKGKHVLSDCLPCQTMKEAVELVEAVEESGKVYAYGENYCYMPVAFEMRKLYQEGKLGEFLYGEGEYLHNSISTKGTAVPGLTLGNKNHWRNNIYCTFYCTHSIGPIMHATGLRPVSVIGHELPLDEKAVALGNKSGGCAAIEMVTLENGGVIRSSHGGVSRDSTWFSLYGTKGQIESARETTNPGKGVETAYVKLGNDCSTYRPTLIHHEASLAHGHNGADFYNMYYFIQKILGDDTADIVDIYEALDMGLCGMFAYRSILKGGIPMEVPNLRDKSIRDKWKNDTMCTDKKVAGDQYIPPYSKGEIEIADEVYDYVKSLLIENGKNNPDDWRAQIYAKHGNKEENK